MVKLSFWCLLALPLMATATNQDDENLVYRWTDSQGNVHFSQTPPPQQKVDQLLVEVSKPSPAKASTDSGAEEDAAKARTPLEKMSARIEAECQRARENLAVLTTYDRVRIKDSQGNFTLLHGEEKERQIAEHQQLVEEMCNKKGG